MGPTLLFSFKQRLCHEDWPYARRRIFQNVVVLIPRTPADKFVVQKIAIYLVAKLAW